MDLSHADGQLERGPSHHTQCFFAAPTIASLSPLDAYSIPQVPPSQLLGVKGSPTAATQGVGAPGLRQMVLS